MNSLRISLCLGLAILSSFNSSIAQQPISLIYMSRPAARMDTGFEKQNDIPAYSHGKLRLNELNSRIIRHFIRHYGEPAIADWSLNSDDTKVAALNKNGVMTWVSYASNGEFLHAHKLYNEDQLDGAIRHRIKTIYYDWQVESVIETNINESNYYLVSISSKKSSGRYDYLVLYLNDEDEMRTVQEYAESQPIKNIATR